jgi:hypothetical protein
MKEREDLAEKRGQERDKKTKAKEDERKQQEAEKEQKEKQRHQALLAKVASGETLTWQEMEERHRQEREARVAVRCEELRASATGFEPAKASEGRHRRLSMEKFYPDFCDDYLTRQAVEGQERQEREQMVHTRREEERVEREGRKKGPGASTGSRTGSRPESRSGSNSRPKSPAGAPASAASGSDTRPRSAPVRRPGADDPSQVVANLDRQRQAWDELSRKNKEKRKLDEAVRREAAAKLCTATTKKEEGKIFHGTESMVNRAIKAERKRADREREKAAEEDEKLRKKLAHDMRVTDKLRNAKPPEEGRRLPAHRGDMNRLRVMDSDRQARLDLLVNPPKKDALKREEEKARVEREKYLVLLGKVAKGEALSGQEKRMAQLYDRRQQEAEARAKEQRALQLKVGLVDTL